MNQGRIIVITGSPGTGKTTTASIVAKESDLAKSVHMHTDDFFSLFEQRRDPTPFTGVQRAECRCHRSFPGSCRRYASGGYDVIVDGIVGPWFLEPWRAIVREGYEVHYIVLRGQQRRNHAAGRGTLKTGQENECCPGGNHVGAVLPSGDL